MPTQSIIQLSWLSAYTGLSFLAVNLETEMITSLYYLINQEAETNNSSRQ